MNKLIKKKDIISALPPVIGNLICLNLSTENESIIHKQNQTYDKNLLNIFKTGDVNDNKRVSNVIFHLSNV